MKAWWFGDKSMRLGYGDGRAIVIGETLKIHGELEICRNGLHASVDILDALSFRKGTVVHRVELSGDIVEGGVKLCASERTHIWWLDIEDVLKEWAIACAERVLPIYEEHYPDDERPRKAIEAAKQYLAGTDSAAVSAAADAVSAAVSAAADAASAAADAADAAYDAAVAVYAAADAAYAAADSAVRAAVYDAAYAAAYDAAYAADAAADAVYAAADAAASDAAASDAAASDAADADAYDAVRAEESKWQRRSLISRISAKRRALGGE